jgi:hypothetical protein
LSDTAATPGPLPPPPHRSAGGGCLWGCLFGALIAIAAVVGGYSYLHWYLFNGFKNDSTLQVVMARVNRDALARSVLGDDIAVTSLSGTSINSQLGSGTTASYVAQVKGTKAQGTISATTVTQDHNIRITALTLTGPDGHVYDLLGGGQQAPPSDSI